MFYAVALGEGRPSPAGLLLAFSGFVPTVAGWAAALGGREALSVLIHHGRRDPVISVEFARRANELLASAGIAVTYLETDAAHFVPASALGVARKQVAELTPTPASAD